MYIKTSDNINLYVNRVGEGLDCIYIHGGPGAWSKDFEIFFGDYLKDKLNLVYLDQRGCGRSDGNYLNNYSIDRLVEDIEDVRKKLNINKFVLIAHSFGGIIATSYANKYNENLTGLILMNCTLDFKDSLKSQIIEGNNILNNKTDYNLEELSLEKLIYYWRKTIFSLANNNLNYLLQFSNIENYYKLIKLDEQIENFKMSELAFNNNQYFLDYTNLSKNISTKTLVIVGNQDYAVGINHHRKFKFKNSIIKTINGKHTPYIENTDELIITINDFIKNLC